MSFVDCMSFFRLRSAHDPKAAFLGIFERIETTNNNHEIIGIKNHLNAHGRFALASMYHFSAHSMPKREVCIIEDGVNFTISGFGLK